MTGLWICVGSAHPEVDAACPLGKRRPGSDRLRTGTFDGRM